MGAFSRNRFGSSWSSTVWASSQCLNGWQWSRASLAISLRNISPPLTLSLSLSLTHTHTLNHTYTHTHTNKHTHTYKQTHTHKQTHKHSSPPELISLLTLHTHTHSSAALCWRQE